MDGHRELGSSRNGLMGLASTRRENMSECSFVFGPSIEHLLDDECDCDGDDDDLRNPE